MKKIAFTALVILLFAGLMVPLGVLAEDKPSATDREVPQIYTWEEGESRTDGASIGSNASCSGTCGGLSFTCTGSDVSCSDGEGCTASGGGVTLELVCLS